MGWFLYENGLRHERVKVNDFWLVETFVSECLIFNEK